MDQTTFLNELLTLKNRVTEMASTFNRSARPQNPHDMFSDHLEDVKARLQSMQTSLGLLSARQEGQTTSPRPVSQDHLLHTSALPSMPSTLPSGPLFWQLFNSLRADVRGLASRVAGIEQDVADLEDRLDDMRPDRFTPSGSEDMYLPHPQSGFVGMGDTNNDFPFRLPFIDERPITPLAVVQHGMVTDSYAAPEVTAHAPAGCPVPEGVAFRDREIVSYLSGSPSCPISHLLTQI
jgi:hypothetical protein